MKQTPSPQWLTRSKFIKLGASVVGATAGAYILYEMAPWMDGKSTARRNREPLVSATGGGPPIRQLIRYATLAANGFRFRVPYGTLLCVSDKPLHGEIKLPGMANAFYRERVDQHLRIGMRAIELLRRQRLDQLHSRKLRSFAEVAFQ